MEKAYCTTVKAGKGEMVLVATERALIRATSKREKEKACGELAGRFSIMEGSNRVLRQASKELKEYYSGRRKRFDVRLQFVTGTTFQRAVWKAMMRIPYGSTVSYGELAKKVGRPSASRAVGQACKANPIPIFNPCHRVIGSDGSLTGFGGPSASGIREKKRLLELEGAL